MDGHINGQIKSYMRLKSRHTKGFERRDLGQNSRKSQLLRPLSPKKLDAQFLLMGIGPLV